jgi:hypothetical protein
MTTRAKDELQINKRKPQLVNSNLNHVMKKKSEENERRPNPVTQKKLHVYFLTEDKSFSQRSDSIYTVGCSNQTEYKHRKFSMKSISIKI